MRDPRQVFSLVGSRKKTCRRIAFEMNSFLVAAGESDESHLKHGDQRLSDAICQRYLYIISDKSSDDEDVTLALQEMFEDMGLMQPV